MRRSQEYMKIKEHHTQPITSHSKGELVDDKDRGDLVISLKDKPNNPYKTPPNNLTTKNDDNY